MVQGTLLVAGACACVFVGVCQPFLCLVHNWNERGSFPSEKTQFKQVDRSMITVEAVTDVTIELRDKSRLRPMYQHAVKFRLPIVFTTICRPLDVLASSVGGHHDWTLRCDFIGRGRVLR